MISRPLPVKSHRRTLAVGVIKRLLDLDETQLQSKVFQRRADAFLFQRVAGERVSIMLGGRRIDAGQSDRVGHFQHAIDLDEADVDALASRPDSVTNAGGCRWLSYEAAVAADGDHADGLLPQAAAAAARTWPAAGAGADDHGDEEIVPFYVGQACDCEAINVIE